MKIDWRSALLDANLRQFTDTMEQAPEPEFSSRYQSACANMLAAPLVWAKRVGRPRWKKALQAAACIVLAFTLALGALMGVSPAVRAAVVNWFREIRAHCIFYNSTDTAEQAGAPVWRPGWLPEGSALSDLWITEDQATWRLTVPDNDGNTSLMRILCMAPNGSSVGMDFGDSEIEAIPTTIQGQPADYYSSENGDALIWENPEGYLFRISTPGGSSTQALLEKVGAHIVPFPDQAEAYTPVWLPEGYEGHGSGSCFPGAGQLELMKGSNPLTFQYVTQQPIPWSTPKNREPRTVDILGNSGLLWSSVLPESQEDTTVEVGGVSIAAGHTTGEEGILIWTDPKSQTTFRIKGLLSDEDFLRMAESVAASQPFDPTAEPCSDEANGAS